MGWPEVYEAYFFPSLGFRGCSPLQLVREALLGWFGPCVGKERKKVWLSAPLCLFWIIWKERNSRAFENEEQSIHGCKSFFLCNLWAWTRGFFGSGPPSIVDFVEWLGAG